MTSLSTLTSSGSQPSHGRVTLREERAEFREHRVRCGAGDLYLEGLILTLLSDGVATRRQGQPLSSLASYPSRQPKAVGVRFPRLLQGSFGVVPPEDLVWAEVLVLVSVHGQGPEPGELL